MSTYVLKPRPPRLLGLAALLVVLAAVAFGVGWAWSYRFAFWVGAAVAGGLGLLLVLVSVVALRRRRLYIDLDADGYAIWGPTGERTGTWKDVTRVALSKRRDKLALYHGERRRTIIAHPAGYPDDEFLRLRHEISGYLDE
ncbi:MAG: hypothetical protein LBR33_04685 [Propionibacteriaceae bacterium]|jgi:hypothetical protein|nr:hypothetical protein [Propionibacteriaceae bacterium]